MTRSLEHIVSDIHEAAERIDEPAVAPEPASDPDRDLAEGRLTRHDSSEAFIASLEQRS